MKRAIILITFLLMGLLNQPLHAGDFRPAEDDTLNYTHVIFQWDQVAGAAAYQLQVAIDDTAGGADPFASTAVDIIDSTLLVIVTDSLDWDESYIWRVRSIDTSNSSGAWSAELHFTIAALPSSLPTMLTTMYDASSYAGGLTMFDIVNTGYTFAFDETGEPVHFMTTDDPVKYSTFRAYSWLPNGNIAATVSSGRPNHAAWEMTLDGDILWSLIEGEAGANYELGGDFMKLPNGNYLGLDREYKDVLIPDGPWKQALIDSGFTTFPYLSDAVVELDETGMAVWSVNLFDLFNTADYDSASWDSAQRRGRYDWTHFNALFYDEVEDMIYLSSRNLSRITKIDHKTGTVVWNMGRNEFPYGISPDVSVGSNLNFSLQHAIEALPNGNLIFYNNDNRTGKQTQVLEVAVDGTGPTDPNPTVSIVWQYDLPDSLYTPSRGDADRLANGNTLITLANPENIDIPAQLWEVDAAGNLIWKLEVGDVTKRLFSAERVPGLYAQAFSVIGPDFSAFIGNPTIFIPVGTTAIDFHLYNEGWLDETYDYRLSDSDGWFNKTGSIAVASGDSTTISLEGSVFYLEYPDIIRMVVTPQHAPARSDTLYLYAYSLETVAVDNISELPTRFALHQNYPNPFNPSTSVGFDLPNQSPVNLIVYDIAGREVVRLVDDTRPAGYHELPWSGRDAAGSQVASGIYFARLTTPEYTKSIKMLLLK